MVGYICYDGVLKCINFNVFCGKKIKRYIVYFVVVIVC